MNANAGSELLLERFRLTGRVALVTGSGRGMGAAAAISLAQAGADLVLCARSEQDLRMVAKQVEELGRVALAVPLDLCLPDAGTELVSQAMGTFDRLDIVVNNMGTANLKPFSATTAADLNEAVQFNVGIAHAVTSAALPHLLAAASRTPSAVVNITSTMATAGARGWLTYGTAKAALAHYTRLAAADLAPKIRVNAVSPGAIATGALRHALRDEGFRDALVAGTPMRRVGTADDVAAAVLYLCSPASSYVTGAVLDVDGGIDKPTMDFGLPDL